MAIDKYVYITLNPKFDGRIRLSYSKTENVDTARQLKHDLARACLDKYDMEGVEITSISDIPGEGSGLGSSSSFCVGLLNALHMDQHHFQCHPFRLSNDAYDIERKCGHAVGRQDQLAAAYGGLHFYVFKEDGRVNVSPICLEEKIKAELMSSLMLFWTGKTRKASPILASQEKSITHGAGELFAKQIRDLAYDMNNALEVGNIREMGDLIRRDWSFKKSLVSGITETWIEELILTVLKHGATGAKILGAGGGGFLLVVAPPEKQKEIEAVLKLRRIPFKMEEKGSGLIYPQT